MPTDHELMQELTATVHEANDLYTKKLEQLNVRVDEIELAAQKQGLDTVPRRRRTSAQEQAGILPPDAKIADRIRERTDEPDLRGEPFRLGAILQAKATGRRDHLSAPEQKALAEGDDSAGGFLVPGWAFGETIDKARNRARVIEAGCRTMLLPASTTVFPALATGAAGVWHAENAADIEESMTFGRVEAQARTAAVLIRLSRELFEDLTPEGAALIEGDLTQALALKLDYAALRGSGVGNEPMGVRNTPGLNVVSMGTNGATPTNYDPVLDAIGAVREDNGEPTAIIATPRTWGTLAKLKTGLSGDQTQLAQPHEVIALPRLATNQIGDAITWGSSGDTSELYVGEWPRMILGFLPELRVQVLRLTERYADQLQLGLVAWIRGDVIVTRGSYFAVVAGIRP